MGAWNLPRCLGAVKGKMTAGEQTGLIVLGVLYAIPLLGVAALPLRAVWPRRQTPRKTSMNLWIWLGRWEYATGISRDTVTFVVALTVLILGTVHQTVPIAGIACIVCIAIAHTRRIVGNHRALRHLFDNPHMHPEDFFRILFWNRSPWPLYDPITTQSIGPEEADYRVDNPPKPGYLPLLLATYDTGCMASLSMAAFKIEQGDRAIQLFDHIARMWSNRIAYHLRMRLLVTGLEELAKIHDQAIVAFNHESLLDFGLGFFAVGGVPTGRQRVLRLRFMVAKDHFLDNWFIHSVLGVGKAIKNAGMIFVDRSRRGAGAKSIDQAVESILTNDVDVAVFPQGTRAKPHFGADGRPHGAGYYTTNRGPIAGPGHFRNGVARIAAQLTREQDVDILCVGLVGTSRLTPAGSVFSYPGHTVHYHLLPPIHLDKGSDIEITALSRRIEHHMRHAARVHERLLETWKVESGSTDAQCAEIALALAEWNEVDDPIPFATLDSILTYAPKQRGQWLETFYRLATDKVSAEAWSAFREQVGKP
jgi:1-acyl-sn-glycerol-3-phosphate acyltransferase